MRHRRLKSLCQRVMAIHVSFRSRHLHLYLVSPSLNPSKNQYLFYGGTITTKDESHDQIMLIMWQHITFKARNKTKITLETKRFFSI